MKGRSANTITIVRTTSRSSRSSASTARRLPRRSPNRDRRCDLGWVRTLISNKSPQQIEAFNAERRAWAPGNADAQQFFDQARDRIAPGRTDIKNLVRAPRRRGEAADRRRRGLSALQLSRAVGVTGCARAGEFRKGAPLLRRFSTAVD